MGRRWWEGKAPVPAFRVDSPAQQWGMCSQNADKLLKSEVIPHDSKRSVLI